MNPVPNPTDPNQQDRTARNVAIVTTLWADLGRRDFDSVGAHFTPAGHYTDVPAPEDGAFGPIEIAARLRLGLAPLSSYVLHPGTITAQDDRVITEHEETWTWDDEHTVTLPFVSVMDLDDDGIVRWWDYWDLGTVMNAAPASWLEHVMVGYK